MNTSFSPHNPLLQTAVDSTSLGTFKECARKYYYSIVLGRVPRGDSPHLFFGLVLHKAREVYDTERMRGATHDDALAAAVLMALKATWNKVLKRPWISEHNKKNRLSLLRSIVWYLDQLGNNDPIETLRLAAGHPAIELPFRFDSGYRTSKGEPIILCGHLDRIGRLNGFTYIADIKTTTHSLNDPAWAKKYTPHNQFTIYSLAGRVVFDFPVEGVIVDGIEVGVTYTRFQRTLVNRTQAQLEDWLAQQESWLRWMEQCAERNDWPMNEMSCDHFGGCPYREVCSAQPADQIRRLEQDYTQRVWDPLVGRGDI